MEQELYDAICLGDETQVLSLLNELGSCWFDTNSHIVLCKAIECNRPGIAARLLKQGAKADPCDTNKSPRTFPLSMACIQRNLTSIKLLLAHGAQPFLRSTRQQDGEVCPFDVCVWVGHKKSIQLLLEHGYALDVCNRGAIKGCILAQDLDKIKHLLDLVDYTVEEMAMSLLLAIKEGNVDIVQSLLDSGASIDYRLPESMRFDPIVSLRVDGPIDGPLDSTPLMQACRFRKVAIVEQLLKRGADVNAANSFGWTALLATMAAIQRTPMNAQDDNRQIVDVLIQNGAFVNPSDGQGKFSWYLEYQLPGALDRVKETIERFRLFLNSPLLRIAQTLVKAGARSFWPMVQLVEELNHHDPVAENENACELARLCIRSTQPHGKLFHIQKMIWSKKGTKMAGLVRDSLEESLTLQSLCCLKIRKAIRPPLVVTLQSSDIPLPLPLKRKIIELT